MALLSREIVTAIVLEHGREELLSRLSDPFWFQAFGCVLGFDWHSSGLTTTVCGALKVGLEERGPEIGVFVAGGKGRASRRTPEEIEAFGERYGLGREVERLVYASRMSAKVDNTALQDGYQLYHHTFIFTSSGEWAVVQQGMNPDTGWARRYHWLGRDVRDFVREPHSAVCCDHRGRALNMVAEESEDARRASALLSREDPEKLVRELKRIKELELPSRHEVLGSDINPESIRKVLLRTYEEGPEDFEELLGIRGVGPKTVRALALLSELIYGSTPSFRDPAKFSFAHGGKDRRPYPVDRRTYDRSIEVLRSAVERARLGRRERMEALRRLARI